MSQPVMIEKTEDPLHARPQPACFVCGQDNPQGLQIQFQRSERGKVFATWCPGAVWERFRGIVHGGVVSTVLDEAMSKAVASAGNEALTAELRVRFRRHVTSGNRYMIRGWIVKHNKRLIEAEATLTALDTTEHAHAWARFLALSKASP